MKIIYLLLIMVLNIYSRKRNKICKDADCDKHCRLISIKDKNGKPKMCNKAYCYPGQKPICYCKYVDPDDPTGIPIDCPNASLPASYPQADGREMTSEEILNKQAELKNQKRAIEQAITGKVSLNKKKHHHK